MKSASFWHTVSYESRVQGDRIYLNVLFALTCKRHKLSRYRPPEPKKKTRRHVHEASRVEHVGADLAVDLATGWSVSGVNVLKHTIIQLALLLRPVIVAVVAVGAAGAAAVVVAVVAEAQVLVVVMAVIVVVVVVAVAVGPVVAVVAVVLAVVVVVVAVVLLLKTTTTTTTITTITLRSLAPDQYHD